MYFTAISPYWAGCPLCAPVEADCQRQTAISNWPAWPRSLQRIRRCSEVAQIEAVARRANASGDLAECGFYRDIKSGQRQRPSVRNPRSNNCGSGYIAVQIARGQKKLKVRSRAVGSLNLMQEIGKQVTTKQEICRCLGAGT